MDILAGSVSAGEVHGSGQDALVRTGPPYPSDRNPDLRR